MANSNPSDANTETGPGSPVGTNRMVRRESGSAKTSGIFGARPNNEENGNKRKWIIIAIIIALIFIAGLIALIVWLVNRGSSPTPAPDVWKPEIVGQTVQFGSPSEDMFSYPNATTLSTFSDDKEWRINNLRVFMTAGFAQSYQLFFNGNETAVPDDILNEVYFEGDETPEYIDVEVDTSKPIKYLKACHGTAGLAFYNAKDEEPLNSVTYWN